MKSIATDVITISSTDPTRPPVLQVGGQLSLNNGFETRIGGQAHVPAVHTKALAGRGELTWRWMLAAAGASGDRVLTGKQTKITTNCMFMGRSSNLFVASNYRHSPNSFLITTKSCGILSRAANVSHLTTRILHHHHRHYRNNCRSLAQSATVVSSLYHNAHFRQHFSNAF